VDRTWH